jgi:hypothetical protein
MATFKIEPHTVREGEFVVCVFDDDGKFVATVCWRDDNIIVTSKYIDTILLDDDIPATALIKLRERT